MPTDAASRMREIVGALAPILKDAGFRKRRHTFNRQSSDTVTHVVNVQMGPHDPPGTVEIPEHRPNLYGLFTVNLGVFSTTLHLMDYEVKRWINEYQCQLRVRLGELVTDYQHDLWWRLDVRATNVEDDVSRALVEHGLPWLDQLPTDETILRRYRELGRVKLGMAPRAPLDIAALQVALGDKEGAVQTGRLYLAEDLNPRHRRVAERTLQGLGLDAALRRAHPPDRRGP